MGKSMKEFVIDCRDLKKALKMLVPFMSKDSTRYYLKGVFFRADKETATMVATDGHRLLEVKERLTNSSGEVKFIISDRDVKNMVTILGGIDKGKICVSVKGGLVKFFYMQEGIEYTCKEIDGTYLDYEKVKPKKEESMNLTYDNINAQYLYDALKSVGNKKDLVFSITRYGEMEPVVIRSKYDNVTCLIMPMRL